MDKTTHLAAILGQIGHKNAAYPLQKIWITGTIWGKCWRWGEREEALRMQSLSSSVITQLDLDFQATVCIYSPSYISGGINPPHFWLDSPD